jgi:hypothetical protein
MGGSSTDVLELARSLLWAGSLRCNARWVALKSSLASSYANKACVVFFNYLFEDFLQYITLSSSVLKHRSVLDMAGSRFIFFTWRSNIFSSMVPAVTSLQLN